MDILLLKILSVFVIFFCGWGGGWTPIFWFKDFRGEKRVRALSLTCTFAGGVFLAASLLHMLPDALDDYGHEDDYPVITLIASGGFLLVLACSHGGNPTLIPGTKKPVKGITVQDEGEVKSERLLGQADSVSEDCESKNGQSGADLGSIQAIALLFALTIHSVITGLALGVADSTDETIVIFIAVIAHKITAAFALGSKYLDSTISQSATLKYLLFFATTTPFGIILGIIILEASGDVSDTVSAICTAVAAGTFLQIASSQLNDEFAPGKPLFFAKSATCLLGFAIMAVLAFFV